MLGAAGHIIILHMGKCTILYFVQNSILIRKEERYVSKNEKNKAAVGEGRKEGEWALNIKSVIIFGRICLVDEQEKALAICRNLCLKFMDDEEYIKKEIENAGKRVQCLELIPEHMTRKLVNATSGVRLYKLSRKKNTIKI